MKPIIYSILKYSMTFLFLLLCFHALLYLASSFPSEAIYENVLSSAQTLIDQGELPTIGFMEKVDNSTDALILNEAYSIDSEQPLESYMHVRKNYKNGVTQTILNDKEGSLYSYAENKHDIDGTPIPDEEYANCLELYHFLQDKITTSVNYTRYYHGYLVIFRPLLLLFDITGIRVLLIAIYFLLLLCMGYLLKKKLDTKTMLVFLYALLIYGYFYAAYCLETSMLFLVCMISSILLLKKIETITPQKLYLHLFITGAITNYLDFLTVPVLTLAMPLLLYLLYQKKKETFSPSFGQGFRFIFTSGIIWCLGYGFTWCSKWIIFDLLYHEGGITSAIQQIRYRSLGDMTRVTEMMGSSLNIFFSTFLIGIILFLIPLLFSKKVTFHKFRLQNLKKEKDIILVAIIPIAWCLLLLNHSILHIMFTYRNMLIPFIVTLLILCQHFDICSDSAAPKNRKK